MPNLISQSEESVSGLSAAEVQLLTAKSNEAKALAYCPYSQFRVGCALLRKDAADPEKGLILGANVENASYPVGTCAERAAVTAAVVAGWKYGDLKAIAVATDLVGTLASPCGMCRQFLREFCEPTMPIIMHGQDGEYVVKTMEELLPMSFGPESLPKPDAMKEIRGGS
ncbi:cytidine deaminase [Eremomyces bilateralis CBS 781.70]|uniref:Cytidine deaminase n=1 Tax=Eremomyces bilateralis CBS 781.70 TaxID=1392243 RepID=A0A6G1FRX5_9PEZI|nr:cytidine deaminase [Eremomyces bilateralis CBS 781.70]KAF1808486.1 cytidine deaminase [Eremomyces bilateralis CBS 781.70]